MRKDTSVQEKLKNLHWRKNQWGRKNDRNPNVPSFEDLRQQGTSIVTKNHQQQQRDCTHMFTKSAGRTKKKKRTRHSKQRLLQESSPDRNHPWKKRNDSRLRRIYAHVEQERPQSWIKEQFGNRKNLVRLAHRMDQSLRQEKLLSTSEIWTCLWHSVYWKIHLPCSRWKNEAKNMGIPTNGRKDNHPHKP